MKGKFLVIACLLLFCNAARGQDIFIVAYKGTISFDDGRVLQPNFRYSINRGNTLKFQIGATALVFTKDKYFDMDRLSVETVYSYAQFVNRFNTTPSQKNNGFIAYLQKTHLFANTIKESSKGAVIAGVKGIEGNNNNPVKDVNETIFPQDSVRMLTSHVHLKWETTGKSYGTKLLVINTMSNDTIRNVAAAGKGELDITIEQEGIYNWFLYAKLENKKSIERVIIKPSPAETAGLKSRLEDFKKQIAAFDGELKALIWEDYLYQNRIIE